MIPNIGNVGPIVVSPFDRGVPVVSVTTVANEVDARAVFDRRKDYQIFGLTYRVQFSDAELSIWEDSTATPAKIAGDSEIEVMTVPYPLLLGTGRKAQFFRVRITGP